MAGSQTGTNGSEIFNRCNDAPVRAIIIINRLYISRGGIGHDLRCMGHKIRPRRWMRRNDRVCSGENNKRHFRMILIDWKFVFGYSGKMTFSCERCGLIRQTARDVINYLRQP
jgi:hypothetical protein